MSSGGSAIRGSRVGAGPGGEAERGDAAPRMEISYFCVNGHVTRPAFAMDATVPEEWDCPRCGQLASTDPDNPPARGRNVPYKTHLAYVKERRSDADAQALLDEAVKDLRARRERGEVIY